MNMPDNLRQQIQRDEAWLRRRLVDAEPPHLDRLKRVVRVALHEQWLEDQLGEELPHALADRIKRRVRNTLETSSVAGAARTVRKKGLRLIRWGGVLGVAAAACWFVVLVVPQQTPTTVPPSIGVDLVDTFMSYTEDEWSLSLEDVEDALSELEMNQATWYANGDDEALGNMIDTIDDLLVQQEWDQS